MEEIAFQSRTNDSENRDFTYARLKNNYKYSSKKEFLSDMSTNVSLRKSSGRVWTERPKSNVENHYIFAGVVSQGSEQSQPVLVWHGIPHIGITMNDIISLIALY